VPQPTRPSPQVAQQPPPAVVVAPRTEAVAVAPTPRPQTAPAPVREVTPAPSAPLAPAVPGPPVAAGPIAPPLRAAAPKAEEVDGKALDRFALEIQKRVGKIVNERGERAYPRLARERRWEGTAQVAVEYGADGKLKRVTIAESSGYSVLDQRAVEMVQEVLPPVPRELRSRNFTVRLPILFKLKEKE
jgi:protein TonB